jgi:cysteine-rich repeat protein
MRSRICSALIPLTIVMLLGSGTALAASNACKADLNGDLVVNFGDLAILKSVFFQHCHDPGPTCGDGLAQGPAEECDDGNVLNGDGCSSTCQIEPPVAAGGLPATGQTTCWNSAGTVISCAGTGQDGDLQAGATLAYLDNGNGTITDTNTGLQWEKLSDDGTIHDKDNTYTWAQAVDQRVAALNAGSGFAGYTDWRTPNRRELESLLNLQNGSPSVSPAFNTGCGANSSGNPGCTVLTCSCTISSWYWCSSSYAPTPTLAWVVSFNDGFVSPASETTGYGVRAVRAGS